MNNQEFILGRELSLEEIKLLADGTKVWVNENYGDSIPSEVNVKIGDILEGESGHYNFEQGDIFGRYGCESVQEICILSENQPITFEQAKELEDGTKVFVVDKGFSNLFWTIKKEDGLNTPNGTRYVFDYKGNTYGFKSMPRQVDLYVSNEIKLSKQQDASEFKIGDRVVSLSHEECGKQFSKTGKVIDVAQNSCCIEFDEFVDGHSDCGKGKEGYCLWVALNKIQKLDTVHYNLPIKIDKCKEKNGYTIGQRINVREYGMGTIIDFSNYSLGVAYDNNTGDLSSCNIGGLGVNDNYCDCNYGHYTKLSEIVGYVEPKQNEEKMEEKVMNEFKVGDRVKVLSVGSFVEAINQLGTIIKVLEDKYVVKFDKHVDGWGSKELGIKYGYGLYVSKRNVEKAVEKPQVKVSTLNATIEYKGNKTTAKLGGVSASARCNPNDEYNKEIGTGIALQRLGEKLVKIGEEDIAKKKVEAITVMTKQDFIDFLDGEVAINCRTEDDAMELMKMCEALGVIWRSGRKATINFHFDDEKENTCYRLDGHLVYDSIDYYKSNGNKIVKFK